MTFRRRDVLAAAAALPLAGTVLDAAVPATGAGPDDEAYWAGIAAQYDVTRDIIQLENANWGMMAKPVMATYERLVERVNRENSYYARRGMGADLGAARARLAALAGCGTDEIVFTRNATEALKGLIGGYNRLRPGDTVLYADLDYDSMSTCMRSLGERRGVTVTKIALPEPASHQAVIDAYDAAFRADPKIRMVLLTHLSHRTGLVIPVREIVAMARTRGIDAIVDAAHSWCQLDFSLPDLDADFVGLNCHKWLGVPLGVGAMYVRKSRLDAIDHDVANEPADTIDAKVHVGTADFAAVLSVPAAIDFQQGIGGAARAARLSGLRNRWVEAVKGLDGLTVLTPDDPRMHGGITSFRIRGLTSNADNIAVSKALLDRYRIFSVYRGDVAKGACVRIAPALFNSAADVDALAAALKDLVPKMRV